MPTIRVEDDVLDGLKSLAEPFTDTPNTVIRRLLQGHGALAKPPVTPPTATRRAIKREGLTPQPLYEIFLVHVLAMQFNGVSEKIPATKAVIALMKEHGFINPADEQRVQTGETKAENTIAWGRNALKERGLINRNSPRGTWALTTKGLADARKIVLPQNGSAAGLRG